VRGAEPVARAARSGHLPLALLCAAAVASVAYLLVLGGQVSFWLDEWDFLLHRRGLSADVFLEPHNDHIAILHVAIYKGVLAVFGMDSQRPFHVASLILFLTSVAVLFVYLRRRVGPWLALAGVMPILFIGTAWDNLLTAFQMAFFGSMASGIGMLLALERPGRRADLLACALLVISITTSSLGLAFLIAAAVHVGWDSARWRRAFVAAIPAGVYALWWLGWGQEAQSAITLHNIATAPGYVLDGLAGSMASLLGLTAEDGLAPSLAWGRPLLLLAVVFAAWRISTARTVSRELVAVGLLGLGFWYLAATNAGIFREADNGRYQYMGAVIVLLIAAEMLRGARPGRRALLVVYTLVAVAVVNGVFVIHRGWEGLAGTIDRERGALAALEIASETVDPAFTLTDETAGALYGDIDAASYLSAVAEFGSPAYTPAELAEASESARSVADGVLAAAHGLALERVARPPLSMEGCTRVEPSTAAPASVTLPVGETLIAPAGEGRAELRLRRYADLSSLTLGKLRAGGVATLAIPADRSTQPWELELSGVGRVSVCADDG